MSAPLIVIGDRFIGFAQDSNIVTVSEARKYLARFRQQQDRSRLTVRFGQGISDYEYELLVEDVERLGLRGEVVLEWAPVTLASRREAHKHSENNVLIADLHESDGRYQATLRVHNDNELLLDHQTGMHVQGMVVAEAARQMFLATGERYLAPSPHGHEYYYVIEKMATTYENFLFPLSSTIILRVRSLRPYDTSRISVRCDIEFMQAGRRCALVEVAFTAFAPTVIGSKERRRAAVAIGFECQPEREPAHA
jgi:hypothetical protein